MNIDERFLALSQSDIETVQAFADCNMNATKAAKIIGVSAGLAVTHRLEVVERKTQIDPNTFYGLREILNIIEQAKADIQYEQNT